MNVGAYSLLHDVLLVNAFAVFVPENSFNHGNNNSSFNGNMNKTK